MSNTDQIVALLISERDKLSRAIEALQGPAKRRGRPPKSGVTSVMVGVAGASTVGAVRKKRTFTVAQKKEQAARMKAYWAARNAAKKAGK